MHCTLEGFYFLDEGSTRVQLTHTRSSSPPCGKRLQTAYHIKGYPLEDNALSQSDPILHLNQDRPRLTSQQSRKSYDDLTESVNSEVSDLMLDLHQYDLSSTKRMQMQNKLNDIKVEEELIVKRLSFVKQQIKTLEGKLQDE